MIIFTTIIGRMLVLFMYKKIKIFCRSRFFSFLVGLRTYQHPCNVRHTVRIKKFLVMEIPLSSNSFTSLSFKQRIISQLCH